MIACECGRIWGWGFTSLRCDRCPDITKTWWFRLDEWCHRHLPMLPFWPWKLHAPLCSYVERRLAPGNSHEAQS